MRLKGRLKEIFKFISPYRGTVYDLFCDHGYLGGALLKSDARKVIFNDKRDHLIDKLRVKYENNEQAFFEACEAENIVFEKNSVVVMAGVGGLKMISCFKRWLGTHDIECIKTLQFIISPHYYTFELRHFLITNGFKYNSEILVEDGKHIYEVANVELNRGAECSIVFEKTIWEEHGVKGERFLSRTFKNLLNKSVLSSWERELLEGIKDLYSFE